MYGVKNISIVRAAKQPLKSIVEAVSVAPVIQRFTAMHAKENPSMVISEADLKSIRVKKAQRHKFGAVSCEIDGKKFPSRLERRYYEQLLIRKKAGDVVFFLRQVAFEIGGGVKYVTDFMVFLSDGSVEFIDTKGRDTPLSLSKRKILEAMYPVEIKIVNKV